MKDINTVVAELVSLNPSPNDGSMESDGAETLARILASDPTSAVPAGEQVPFAQSTAPRGRGRWILAAAAAIMLVAAAVAAGLVGAGPAARAKRNAVASTPQLSWSLAANVNGPSFEPSNTPAAISNVNCMDASTCFLSTVYGMDYGGQGQLYISHDGGYQWSLVQLPQNLAPTTPVSCAGSGWCAFGAGLLDPKAGDPEADKPMRDPELVVTSNGGATWSVSPVPLPVESLVIPAEPGFPSELTHWPSWIDSVACSAPGVCNLFSNGGGVNPTTVVFGFAATTDGGLHWTQTILPQRQADAGAQASAAPEEEEEAMACPSASDCVVTASYDGTTQNVWRTTDDGATWSEVHLDPGNTTGNQISCSSVDSCWIPLDGGAPVVLHSTDGGATWTLAPTLPGTFTEISCVNTSVCYLAGEGIAETVNGGKTWTMTKLPPSVAGEGILSIECDPSGLCVASTDPSPVGSTVGTLLLTNAPPPRH